MFHLLFLPDGRRLPVTATDADDAARLAAATARLDRATVRLLEQRHHGARDFRSGRASSRLLSHLRLGAEDVGTERGHFTWWPQGVFVRRSLADWLRRYHEIELQAAPIITPVLRSWEDNSVLRRLAGDYSPRLYGVTLEGDREGILTYGGDPGFLSLLASMPEVPAALPWRVYEQVWGHRRCRRGELGGLQRSRSFEFFDFHSLVTRELGIGEYLDLIARQVGFVVRHGHGAAVEVRVDRADEQALDDLGAFSRRSELPIVVGLTDRTDKYYRLLHNLYDNQGLHTMHGQLDEVNAEAWMGDAGAELTVIHAASGALERWLLVYLLDAEARSCRALPDWLAPTQLTLVPVSPEHHDGAAGVAQDLAASGVRVQVDDRTLSVGRRIRDSVDTWVPRTVVVGERELKDPDETLLVRDGSGELRPYDWAGLARELGNTDPTVSSAPVAPRWLSAEPRFG